MLKKFIVAGLFIAFSLSMAASANHSEETSGTVPEDGISLKESTGFDIIETVDENNQIIRTFTREECAEEENQGITAGSAPIEDDQYAETKELLLALGMEQDFIDNLSEDALETYATCESLVGSISYSKTDADGNQIYLEEAVAIEEAEAVSEPGKTEEGSRRSKRAAATKRWQQTETDSYMRLFYLVTYLGNGKYKFSTDARWLTMPGIRGIDSIGSSAMTCTVENPTRSGYVQYNNYSRIDGKSNTKRRKVVFGKKNFRNAVNGNWYGSGATFQLPLDSVAPEVEIRNTNLKAHYEYVGKISTPDQTVNFNTLGSYDHLTIRLDVGLPNLTIGKNISGAIGLSVRGVTETRCAEIAPSIAYKP